MSERGKGKETKTRWKFPLVAPMPPLPPSLPPSLPPFLPQRSQQPLPLFLRGQRPVGPQEVGKGGVGGQDGGGNSSFNIGNLEEDVGEAVVDLQLRGEGGREKGREGGRGMKRMEGGGGREGGREGKLTFISLSCRRIVEAKRDHSSFITRESKTQSARERMPSSFVMRK